MLTTAKPIAPSNIFFIPTSPALFASVGPRKRFSNSASARPPNFGREYSRFRRQYRLPNATCDDEVRVPEVNDLSHLLWFRREPELCRSRFGALSLAGMHQDTAQPGIAWQEPWNKTGTGPISLLYVWIERPDRRCQGCEKPGRV